MDALSDILSAVHLEGTLYFSTELRAPFGIRVPAFRKVARFHLAVEGSCWVRVSGEREGARLATGDLIVVPHGAEHSLSDAPDSPLLSVDEVIQRAGFTGKGSLIYGGPPSPRPPTPQPEPPVRLLCGHFAFAEDITHPFLERLPAKILIRAEENAGRFALGDAFRFISAELSAEWPGTDAVVHRLSEVLFLQAVRAWAYREGEEGPLAALTDSHIGKSLAALHAAPAREWTLPELAKEAGLSRTLFAERFHRRLGMPPMQYLAFWRVQRSRLLLREEKLSIEAVARRVGYDSVSAFSRVFAKWVGVPPGSYRRTRRSDGPSIATNSPSRTRRFGR